MGEILTDEPGDASWPIAGATFILMHKKPAKIEDAKMALKFFEWAYAKGGQMASDLDYVPMPDAVVSQVKKRMGKDRRRRRQAVDVRLSRSRAPPDPSGGARSSCFGVGDP